MNLLGAERHRAQARAAELVHAPGRRIDGDTGVDRGLPRRVLTGAGRKDLSQDHFGHFARLDARALQGRLDGDFAQFMRWEAGQRAVESADRRAGSTGDHDGGLVLVHR